MTEKIFSDRTALVTGGTRGIGRAISLMLAEHGARVAVNYVRNAQTAEEMLAAIDSRVERTMAVQADVSREDQVGRMIAAVRERLGRSTCR